MKFIDLTCRTTKIKTNSASVKVRFGASSGFYIQLLRVPGNFWEVYRILHFGKHAYLHMGFIVVGVGGLDKLLRFSGVLNELDNVTLNEDGIR